MRWLAAFVCIAVLGETAAVLQTTVKQGETVHLHDFGKATSARMDGRTIRLFPASEGGSAGLMPVPADQKPGVYKIEFLDPSGKPVRSAGITVRDAHFAKQNIVLKKELTELKPSPGEVDKTAAFRKTVSDTRYWSEPLQAPVSGCMTSPFGVQRLQNGRPTGAIHGGVDLRGEAGSPIRATTAGVVRIVEKFNLHGGTVGIDDGQGLESMYLHMSKFATSEGAQVKAGDVIGFVGSTGRSTAPHLHWSLYVNAVAVNPGQWVPLHACAAPRKAARPKKR